MATPTTQKRPMQRDPDAAQAALIVLYNRLVTLLRSQVFFTATGPLAPACAIATTTTQAKTTNATFYKVDGTLKSKAATDNLWTPTGGVLAAGSFRKYLLLLDGSGTASVFSSNDSTVSAAACTWPFGTSIPWDGKGIIGTLTVATDATHTFTPGVGNTALNAAGITSTFVDGEDGTICPMIADMGNNLITSGLY